MKAELDLNNAAHLMEKLTDNFRDQTMEFISVLEYSIIASDAIRTAIEYFEEIGVKLDLEGDLASNTYYKLFTANEETPKIIRDIFLATKTKEIKVEKIQ
ncbi:MAG TPA: hypothetical protein PKY82_00645 [Pyrinomonadaceae bacterium]|nr:hypothetical protein [Pyrinomonadaceae bacterium]